MTRGTIWQSKLVPMTNTDFEQRVACGARGLLNFYSAQSDEILNGYDLNLNSPSVLGSQDFAGRENVILLYIIPTKIVIKIYEDEKFINRLKKGG